MKMSNSVGGALKAIVWVLVFTSLCLWVPSIANAQFFGRQNFQPPQVGSQPVADAAERAQWQSYYTNNPNWWQAGRTSPNGGQGSSPNTYQFPTAGGWPR